MSLVPGNLDERNIALNKSQHRKSEMRCEYLMKYPCMVMQAEQSGAAALTGQILRKAFANEIHLTTGVANVGFLFITDVSWQEIEDRLKPRRARVGIPLWKR